MRKNLMVVAVGVLAFGISSATSVLAEGRSVPKGEQQDVTFRLASSAPAPGFQEMATEDGGTIYVSPRVTFSSDEVLSAMQGSVRGDIDLTLTAEATDRIDRTAGDQLAVLVNGKVATTAYIANVGRENVSISGLSEDEVSRVSRLLGVANPYGSAVIRAVPRQSAAKPGDVVTVDVYVMGVRGMRTFQVALDAVGGRTGTLTREPGVIDEAREDFVFGGARAITAVDDLGGRFGGTLWEGTVDATDQKYLGSFDYRVSDDASGTFVVKVRYNSDTFVMDDQNSQFRFAPMNATIKVGATGARSSR